jgi:hypothetical protein
MGPVASSRPPWSAWGGEEAQDWEAKGEVLEQIAWALIHLDSIDSWISRPLASQEISFYWMEWHPRSRSTVDGVSLMAQMSVDFVGHSYGNDI